MVMVSRCRNRGCVPFLASEGVFERPLIEHDVDDRREDWYAGFSPYDRLHMHHTLASARRYSHFKPFPGLIPRDDLDMLLASTYDHTNESFPDPVDVFMQAETKNMKSWRRLRNTRDMTPDREEQESRACLERTLLEEKADKTAAGMERGANVGNDPSTSERPGRAKKIPYRYNFAHKVLIGGITDRRHPHNIKLMNSSHHSPQTNAGYSRQPSDGTVFQY